jgi:hypothetical protein
MGAFPEPSNGGTVQERRLSASRLNGASIIGTMTAPSPMTIASRPPKLGTA